MFKSEAMFMLLVIPALTVTGLLAAWFGPPLFNHNRVTSGIMHPILLLLPFAFMASGLVCLIIAKVPLCRRGIWISFGQALMAKKYAKLYKFAYFLIAVGLLLVLGLFFR
jgi:hypothetical protein